MTKNSTKKQASELTDALRPEYDLATLLQGAVRGKYAERYKQGTKLDLLEPDVADAFPTQEAVNQALRLIMQLARIPAGHECPN